MAYQTKPYPFAEAFQKLLPQRDIMLFREGDDPENRTSSAFWQAPNGTYNQATAGDDVGMDLTEDEVQALLRNPPYETAILVGDGAKRYEEEVAPTPPAGTYAGETELGDPPWDAGPAEQKWVHEPTRLPLFPSEIAYVPRQIIPFLVGVGSKTTKHVDQKTVEALRSLIEKHAQRIHGLSTSFTKRPQLTSIVGRSPLEYETLGGAMAASNHVIFTFSERYDKAVTALLDEVGYEWSKDGVTFSLVFIEPDPTYTKVVDAWRYEECELTHVEGFNHHRDLARDAPAADCITDDSGKFQSMPPIEATIQGKVLRGRTVREAAQLILDAMILNGANPHHFTATSVVRVAE